ETSALLVRILSEAFSADHVMALTGDAAVGRAFSSLPFDHLLFTGATDVGREVMRAAAANLTPVTLELGGKSPNVVFPDADVDAAVRGATTGIFYGKGEVCAAGSRLFVEKKIHGEFIERLVDRARKLKPGDPLDPKTRLGAIVSERQMNTVLGYIEKGKAQGAKLVAGGNRVSVDGGHGYFIEPTVFDSVDNNMTIAQEEIFGPVLATIPFDDVEQVAELANRNIYGLAAAVWTNDVRKAHNFARRVKAGTVWVNAYNLYDAALPFGGYKQSGFGRELGMHAIEHYTELKSVWVNLG
ncbi:MAG TPA: aldehyde dehydrogenase family protein, partial [Terriglobales bacterium]